ncbi:MAG: trypsin-like peptidase domain-containing protein [Candidatus Kerfeldbacteria bacterium]|nr:trypsin-like peptidase domain-containing protein [Candidatus Kerfeldbacteria bacterium]
MEPLQPPEVRSYQYPSQSGRGLFRSLIVGMLGAALFFFLYNAGILDRIPGFTKLYASRQATSTPISKTVNTIQVQEESATKSVVEKSKPSVVSIVVSEKASKLQSQNSVSPFQNDPFFNQFFGNGGNLFDQNTPFEDDVNKEIEVQEGSGFVVSADGMILTNRHVVNIDDAQYTVIFDDATSYDAKILARDALTDLALLKIDAMGLTPLELADSDQAAVGDTVIAIGNTLGEYSNTVTKGIVSGLSRNLGGEYSGLIQTDAAINQGNSGGPLININGQVIGINTAVDRSGEGIGFAIAINEAKSAIDSVQKNGRIIHPGLGIRYVQITPEVAQVNHLLYDYGAYIKGSQKEPGVIPESAADKAGLKEGDIILEVDGTKVDEDHSLASLIKDHVVGDTVKIKVFTDGQEKTMTVTLEELPEEAQ